LILVALQQFEDESLVEGGNGYEKTLEELKNFKDAESPFSEDFFKMFQSVYKQQMLMLEKLQLRKNKLDKKLKSIHTWRKTLKHHLCGYIRHSTHLLCRGCSHGGSSCGCGSGCSYSCAAGINGEMDRLAVEELRECTQRTERDHQFDAGGDICGG
jgi:hypothetical protein